MRHQDRIYIQNANRCVRNKDHINVGTSSDICIFNSPTFDVDVADKIQTGMTISDNYIHIITGQTGIDFTFTFTGNVETFETLEVTFKYKVYKYNNSTFVFDTPPIFESGDFDYSVISGTSAFTDTVLIADLDIDGEYLIKGSYDFDVCTEILSNFDINVDTSATLYGDEYNIYDDDFDYYFAAIEQAGEPILALSPTDTSQLGNLIVESYIVSGDTFIQTNNTWNGSAIVALNGSTLAEFEDFETEDNDTILFNSPLVDTDIVTVSYVNNGNPNGLTVESINIISPIVSGATDGEGSEIVYYNTGTTKYEIYALSVPLEFNDVIVTLNGVTLANGLDYNQSLTNFKRIILNGVIMVGDILTITYNTFSSYVGIITVDNFDLYWTLTPAPSSYTGTTAWYKVTNRKDYTLILGDVISTETDSEIIPIEITI